MNSFTVDELVYPQYVSEANSSEEGHYQIGLSMRDVKEGLFILFFT